jgi:hypothetical protein
MPTSWQCSPSAAATSWRSPARCSSDACARDCRILSEAYEIAAELADLGSPRAALLARGAASAWDDR